jgi:hypothetical protein
MHPWQWKNCCDLSHIELLDRDNSYQFTQIRHDSIKPRASMSVQGKPVTEGSRSATLQSFLKLGLVFAESPSPLAPRKEIEVAGFRVSPSAAPTQISWIRANPAYSPMP